MTTSSPLAGGAAPDADATQEPDPAPALRLLDAPADGVPAVLTTETGLNAAARALAAGTGPVAVDAERASGFRYGQHNYLVQLRREGSGTFLIDPSALPDLTVINDALRDAEWVFHAASQDLTPLREQHLDPARIFDTELAARLLGMPRVGLGAVVAEVLGLELLKEHSAADWSTRPLPEPWLRYAALDVEVLVELRDALAARLVAAGKWEWAQQEFEAARTAPVPPPRIEPWRRVSRLSQLRTRRQLAVARELWTVREDNGRTRDISPGRVLPDRAIVQAAAAMPRSVPELLALGEFNGRGQRRRAPLWTATIQRALALPEESLPSLRGPRTDGPPQPRVWAEREPAAAARWEAVRPALVALAEELSLPVENLVQPDAVRRLCWDLTIGPDEVSIAAFLRGRGARPWQVDLVAPAAAAVLTALAVRGPADRSDSPETPPAADTPE